MIDREDLRRTAWHTRVVEDVIAEMETDPEAGLSGEEAEQRLERYGRNRIRTRETTPWWTVLLRQFTDPLIYILLFAAAVSAAIGEWTDLSVILGVVLLNGAIGFTQELRARRAIHALAEMTAPRARVLRDGEEREVSTDTVVPGDVILLGAGARVPADARLFRVQELTADESAITGESEPVHKQVDPVADEQAVPGDQTGMVFSGTSITRGRGRGVVVRTGASSELGHIAETAGELGEVRTPVQQKIDRLAKAIGIAVFALAVVVLLTGFLIGMSLPEMLQTAVAMAVAAVPAALPIVLTVTLAIGARRMAKRNAIIRTLPAVETLGSTTVIGSDKTGTLTTNQMTVKVIWSDGQRYEVTGSGFDPEGEILVREESDCRPSEVPEGVRLTLLAGLLANEAEGLPLPPKEDDEGEDRGLGGDPTELALLVSAMKAGFNLQTTRQRYAEVDVVPFESKNQFMATVNETPEGRCVFMKGSPEAIVERCSRRLGSDGRERDDFDRDDALETAHRLADEGYRVLAMALRADETDGFTAGDPGDGFAFAGFQGMEDPVRPEAVEAVRATKKAGIRVLMLTGDHARTARAIGAQLELGGGDPRAVEGRNLDGLSDEEIDELIREVDVYARVSPDHKLKLVQRLKALGHIVTVTGDGVNDAPALQAAHLGVAMGRSGTDVAREASDMVLTDDNFASIVHAVEEGRVVFANVRKVTYFLLVSNVALVATVLAALFGPWALPYVAAQVLWITLVTNGLQDVALAFEGGEPGVLDAPPRDPREGVLNREVLWRLGWVSLLMAGATLGVFWWMLQQEVSLELARSVAMTQMVVLTFFHVWNCRSFERSIFQVPIRANPFLAISIVVAFFAHLGALHLPFLQAIFDTEPLTLTHWAVVLAVGSIVLIAVEIDKALFWRRNRNGHRRRSASSTSVSPRMSER